VLGKTEWVFLGIIVLGILGFLCDRFVRFIVSRALKRYGVLV
jgi:ABC-type nitrate/sulfonate/bicarbonate transport system permease component